jgi:hypothetical protein
MTIPAIYCEVKKLAYRQSKEGIVVSFLVHPQEVPDALAVAPLGQRYMLALAQIGDDERPVEPPSPSTPAAERPGVETGSSPTARARASQFAKERYQEASPMVQACTRAALLAKDIRFQAWAQEHVHGEKEFGLATLTEAGAADYIRETCCNGGSRKLIATDPEAYRKFLALLTMFQIAVGEIAEPR